MMTLKTQLKCEVNHVVQRTVCYWGLLSWCSMDSCHPEQDVQPLCLLCKACKGEEVEADCLWGYSTFAVVYTHLSTSYCLLTLEPNATLWATLESNQWPCVGDNLSLILLAFKERGWVHFDIVVLYFAFISFCFLTGQRRAILQLLLKKLIVSLY